MEKPLYKTWWGILLIILFFPIAVPILVWTKTNWSKGAKIAVTFVCGLFLLAGMAPEEQQASSQDQELAKLEKENQELKQQLEDQNQQAQVASTQDESAQEKEEPQKAPEGYQGEFYEVLSVVDGDTVKVKIEGNSETLRLIGLDTPETKDPRKPVQCFGKEASSKAKELLEGQKVGLEDDPTQGERDKYNRLLRYVYLEDGTLYNKLMIQEGFAHEYTYNIPYKYQEEFKAAEKEARENKRGFWSEDTCGGDTEKPDDDGDESGGDAPNPNSDPVKKSTTGICHAPGSTYYNRTKNFTPYNTLQECLDSGGRLPKR